MGCGAEPQRGLGRSPSGVWGGAPQRNVCDFRPTYPCKFYGTITRSRPLSGLSILHVIYYATNTSYSIPGAGFMSSPSALRSMAHAYGHRRSPHQPRRCAKELGLRSMWGVAGQ
eukprot:1044797-Prymnesium_polylepis.1